MKVAVARGPGRFGGIFRRFREICAHARGRHDVLGLLVNGADDAPLDDPARTLSYSRRHVSWAVARATTLGEVLSACEPLVARIAADLRREATERVLAVDTDLKGLAVVAAARRAGVPVVTFVSGFAQAEAEAAGRVPPFVALAERFCLESSDRLIFPSHFAQAHATSLATRLAPGSVIRNGIAAEFLESGRPSHEVDETRVGAVMRMSPVKNPGALARIAVQLAARGYALDVVTDAAAAQRLAFPHARLLDPTLDTLELAARYAGWRAVVCPSRFEASGNVPMEAIAVGTPAIVTNRMGAAEILQEFGLGHLVVPVDDEAAAVECAVAAAPVPEDTRRALRDRFRWPTVCDRIFEVVEGASA